MAKSLNNKKSGFTLIEIMVAVSIFVIVAFIVTSTLLVILAASQRANKIRLIVDNMNFSLDSMSFKIKFGKNYTLTNNSTLSFFDRDFAPVSYCRADLAGTGSIIKCQFGKCGGYGSVCSFPSCGVNGTTGLLLPSCQSITTPEVNVTNLQFYKTTCGGAVACLNEEYVMFVKANTMVKNDTINLEFQTSVSQSQ